MPRRLRQDVVVPGHPHHVILRGNNRRNLFSYVDCYRSFVEYVDEASRALDLPTHLLSTMRNHVHLGATPSDARHLSEWVKRFAQRYASRRNRKRETSGKLFEQRFTAIPITSERQLAATFAYVELNPVRAGIVEAPDAWPWSTYRLHAGLDGALPEVQSLWTPHPWWLALGTDLGTRAAAYRDLVARRDETAREIERATLEAPATYRHRTERPDRSSAAESTLLDYETRTRPPVRREIG